MFLLILCVAIIIPCSQCLPSESKFRENENSVPQKGGLGPYWPFNIHKRKTSAEPFSPPQGTAAKIARYTVHYMDWTVIAAINSRYPGFPSATPMSVADIKGVPYIYVTLLDSTIQDLAKDPHASFVYSYAQTDYCTRKKLDPEDPRCGKLFLSGMVRNATKEEIPQAKEVFMAKHPYFKTGPHHNFFFAKLEISRISILYGFGGRIPISLKDYFNADA